MKVSKILELSAQCESEEAASKVLDKLLDEVTRTESFKGESGLNMSYYMEGSSPHVNFEIHRELSPEFSLEAKFEIRNKALVGVTNFVRMNDKLGASSKDWSFDEDLEALVEALPDETIAQFSKRVWLELLSVHAHAMEKVGYPFPLARKAAAARAKG